jgi:hypothetical protein
MRSWQDRGMPYYGNRYTALTHHMYWDGQTHYWPAMPVMGMDDQDPENPHCCQDTAVYERGEVCLKRPALARLREELRARGHTHGAAGERLGVGLSSFRQRLYGRRPFSHAEFSLLCRLSGVDPETLTGERGQ